MRKRQQQKEPKPLSEHRALLTPKETANALKVSARTLCYWTASRRGRRPLLPSVKIGKIRRYVVADVLRLIEEFKIAA